MKNMKLAVMGVLAATMALVGCQQAQALDFALGYQDNTVVDEDGVFASVGSEYKNIRYGVSAFTSSERLESYGAYAKLPLYIHQTRFAVTPQAQVEHYRNADEVVGGLGIGLEYKLSDTLRAEAVAMAHEAFDDSSVDGETYTFSLTKTF